MSEHSLYSTFHRDARPEKAAMVLEALCTLPGPLADLCFRRNVTVQVRPSFAGWLEHDPPGWPKGTGYDDTMGVYQPDRKEITLAAHLIPSVEHARAVIFHELGHALSMSLLDDPYWRPDFRRAWSTGRARVKERWPADVLARRALGIFCLHWRVATAEVWAESVSWILGARVLTHHQFGDVFRECVDLVAGTLEAEGWLPREAAG